MKLFIWLVIPFFFLSHHEEKKEENDDYEDNPGNKCGTERKVAYLCV